MTQNLKVLLGLALISLLVSVSPAASMAQQLSMEAVVNSAVNHYPKVLQAVADVEGRRGALQETQGAFDGKLKGSGDARDQGYYNGDAYKIQIEKPIPYLNGRVYGGHRVSRGIFPEYEGKSRTLNRGENFLGVSLSVLRDSLFDAPRYDIQIAKENLQQSELKLEETKLTVQNLAIQSYWTWVTKGYEMDVYSDLLNLAKNRGKGLKRRIRAGDLARIYETENQQYIQKRESKYRQVSADFRQASFYLSLFFRDSNGKRITPNKDQIPNLDQLQLSKTDPLPTLVNAAFGRSYQLRALASQRRQAQQTTRLGKNILLPKVDLAYEISKDQGAAQAPNSFTRAPQETRIMLNVEVPLEFRKGRGKKIQGRMKENETNLKIQFLKEKIRAQLESLHVKIDAIVEISKINKDRISLAQKLTDAEMTKFRRGASDLILVNFREENLAESRLTYLESILKYQIFSAELNELIIRKLFE